MKLTFAILALASVLGVCHAQEDPTTSLSGVADLSEPLSLAYYLTPDQAAAVPTEASIQRAPDAFVG